MKSAFHRLHELRMENQEAGFQMQEMKPRFTRIQNRKENGTAPEAISAFNLFQTPEHIARLMVKVSGLEEGQTVLEPSAGLGRIVQAAAMAKPSKMLAIESDSECIKGLYLSTESVKRLSIKKADFLSVNSGEIGRFDKVIMNPPFKNGLDVKHIEHALLFLKSRGKIVALCYDGVKQNRDLKPIADTWEVLPDNSFKIEGTGASVVMATFIL